jgi:hypothetical protein
MNIPETKLTVETNGTPLEIEPSITFHGANREMFRITHDGRMICGEGLSKEEATQEASKLLIQAFEQEIQKMVDACIAAELAAMKSRAEKAEAKLHALTLICGTNDVNKFQSWVDKERERADKAEAECFEQSRLLGLSGNEVAMLKSKVFRLTSLWSQFFFLLDITEESDSGHAFKPNYFSSCRIADAESMEKILTKAKHELNAGVNKQDL